ncbi:MAG: helix-turn-helix transcriptional regulator [Candidatus Aminicenantes bacterium]
MSSKKNYKDVDKFFKAPLTPNQKAWMLIHEFYHIILSYMKENGISKADLARKLGKSRASVSQMFNKTPNLTIKKMTEIADAVGVEVKIKTEDLEKKNREKSDSYMTEGFKTSVRESNIRSDDWEKSK